MKKLVQLVLLNLALCLGILVVFELAAGHWVQFALNGGKFTHDANYFDNIIEYCWDPDTHHTYCPEIVQRKAMDPEDGGELVYSYVNKDSVRVASAPEIHGNTDLPSYDIVNIGDSMMQADEVSYEQTLSRVIEARTGKKTLQVGFGSWAPILEYGWLQKQPLKQGVQVNLFMVDNDIVADYGNSNLSYQNQSLTKPPELAKFAKFGIASNSWRQILIVNSPTFRIVKRLREQVIKTAFQDQREGYFDEKLTQPETDCGKLDKYQGLGLIARQTVELSFDSRCWSPKAKSAVDSALYDVRKMAAQVAQAGGTLRLIAAPMGWAFAGENEGARKFARYNFSMDAEVTTLGWANYLKDSLADTNVQVVAFEPLIRQMKAQSGQLFYFPHDGHWNAEAHRQLGEWMAVTLHGAAPAQ